MMQVESIEFDVKITEYKEHEFYVPKWAQYLACDADGKLFAYEDKPRWKPNWCEWFPPNHAPRCECIAIMLADGIDCSKTLQRID